MWTHHDQINTSELNTPTKIIKTSQNLTECFIFFEKHHLTLDEKKFNITLKTLSSLKKIYILKKIPLGLGKKIRSSDISLQSRNFTWRSDHFSTSCQFNNQTPKRPQPPPSFNIFIKIVKQPPPLFYARMPHFDFFEHCNELDRIDSFSFQWPMLLASYITTEFP